MSDELLNIRIPASFVLSRLLPTAAQIALGFERGWLRPKDVVEIALAKHKAGKQLGEAEEELALLLSSDLERVEELIPALAVSGESLEQREGVWLFLILDWLWEHRTEIADPFRLIELLYTDFGYPAEIEGLVRYMPAPARGAASLEGRWRAYLDRARVVYRDEGT